MTSKLFKQNFDKIKWTGECARRNDARPKKQRARSRIEVIRDIDPYQSVIDGSVISSRREHREHLKRHNCVEIGSEDNVPTRPKSDPDIKPFIKRAMDLHGF